MTAVFAVIAVHEWRHVATRREGYAYAGLSLFFGFVRESREAVTATKKE